VDGLKTVNETQFYPNDEKYEGQFLNGKKDGFGKLTYARDDQRVYYIGEFKDDKRHGNGKLEWRDGSVYEGEFEDDLMSGNGTIVLSWGAKYEGHFNGKNNGFGKYTYASDDFLDRDYYTGEWKDDLYDGKGKLVWKNGTTYDGEWQQNLRHGFGTLLDSDGAIIFQGQWENDEQKNL
jgi:hypothetical protein